MPKIAPTARSVELRALIEEHRDGVEDVLRRYGAANPRLFGSVARGDATETSDIDLLIERPAGMGLLTMSRVQRELSEIPGVDVDLVPETALLRTVRPRVLADATPL